MSELPPTQLSFYYYFLMRIEFVGFFINEDNRRYSYREVPLPY